jgi:hypothetical protein
MPYRRGVRPERATAEHGEMTGWLSGAKMRSSATDSLDALGLTVPIDCAVCT